MATSLSYTFQNIPVDQVIRDAYAQCGVNPALISGWQYGNANQSLNFLLTSWISKCGLNLFTVEQNMIEIVPNQRQYALPLNTSKILECVFSNANQIVVAGSEYSSIIPNPAYPPNPPDPLVPPFIVSGDPSTIFLASPNNTITCTQTNANGYVQCVFPTPQPIQYIGILTAVTGPYQLSFQCSFIDDNPEPLPADLIQVLNVPAMTYYANQVQWFALPYTETAPLWRIQEVGGNTLDLSQVLLEIPYFTQPMARVGRDSYTFYPANGNTQGPSTAYYMNRAGQPTLNVYTNPNAQYQFFVYNCVRSIQDVGAPTNSFDMTPRFLEAATTGLAARLARMIAPQLQPALQTLADQLFKEAAGEDVENVDLQLSMDSAGYRAS